MKKYVMLYRGGDVPQEKMAENMQEWDEFIKQLGSAQKSGMPFAAGKLVSSDGVEDYKSSHNDVTGYSEIEVESEEVALKIAKMAPNVKHGGVVELREEMAM